MPKKKYILWFKEINNTDVPKVGGKNASLGEMYSKLTSKGVAIPNGFAVTAQASPDHFQETEKAGICASCNKTLTSIN